MTGKLDINSASQEELESLYGIGPVTAKKIINHRPYTTKIDLLKRKIISEDEYKDIQHNIVAHPNAYDQVSALCLYSKRACSKPLSM